LVEAPNYPGPKSFPNGYHFDPYPVDDDTIVFAGPRSDPFFVDLGMIFALVNFRPGTLPGNHGGGTNSIAGSTVHSIALSIPIAKLTKNGSTPTDATDPNAVISMWSSTWRRQSTVLQSNGSVPVESGAWVQVSRLGNPLINEVIIPLGLKDQFNATYPY